MSRLLLIRHGQASFHANDYDQLSEIGHQQAHALGRWLAEQEIRLDSIYVGTKRRQRETAAGVCGILAERGVACPVPVELPGLDEVRFETLVRTLVRERHPEHPELQRLAQEFIAETKPEARPRSFVRLARVAAQLWLTEEKPMEHCELWPEFRTRVDRAFRHMMNAAGRGHTIAAFTSAGPISVMLEAVLHCPPSQALAMWWLLANTAVTEVLFTTDQVTLRSFNSLPHLPNPREWTYL